MDIEKLKYEAQNKALHIADVSGSALFNADCMDILPLIPDKSVQLILADLPYGTTAAKWDCIIPLDTLWSEYKRIIVDGCAIVLTAISNLNGYKHKWIWNWNSLPSERFPSTRRATYSKPPSRPERGSCATHPQGTFSPSTSG